MNTLLETAGKNKWSKWDAWSRSIQPTGLLKDKSTTFTSSTSGGLHAYISEMGETC